ncbi:MAG: HAD family phosphatase [Actinomycetaceae bacterium]|nr:HAD family phosphatase [Actinomycetaceae bacterium]
MSNCGVLFDMDGTLIDSEPYWHNSETAVVEHYGGTWSLEQGKKLTGRTLYESGRIILEESGIEADINEVLHKILDYQIVQLKKRVPWFDGVTELLGDLAVHNVKTALVSSSYRCIVDVVCADAPKGTLDLSIAGDEVTRGKPDPEPYLVAAKSLGLSPHNCVVVEDSPSGVEAGLRAGMKVVGICGDFDFSGQPVTRQIKNLGNMCAEDFLHIVQVHD